PWPACFAQPGLEYRTTGGDLRFNDYALVLQACFAGEGIAMGWHHVVERFIERGNLVQVMPDVYDIGYGFFISWPESGTLTDDASRVVDWIIRANSQPNQ
ncbi:MAG: LysR substrate-binding domain-containing protein, partial [Rhizobiaceae bacterium]